MRRRSLNHPQLDIDVTLGRVVRGDTRGGFASLPARLFTNANEGKKGTR